MLRCPKCHKFGVEHDPCSGALRCLWNDCGYRPTDEEVRTAKHPIRKYSKFIKSIKKKTNIA